MQELNVINSLKVFLKLIFICDETRKEKRYCTLLTCIFWPNDHCRYSTWTTMELGYMLLSLIRSHRSCISQKQWHICILQKMALKRINILDRRFYFVYFNLLALTFLIIPIIFPVDKQK